MVAGTLRLHPLLSLHLSEFLLPGYQRSFCILTLKIAGSLNADLPLHASCLTPLRVSLSDGLVFFSLEGNVLSPASSLLVAWLVLPLLN